MRPSNELSAIPEPGCASGQHCARSRWPDIRNCCRACGTRESCASRQCVSLEWPQGPKPGRLRLSGTRQSDAGGNPRLRVRLADIGRIVLTHADLDHVGGLYELSHALRVPVLCHRLEAPVLPESRHARVSDCGPAGRDALLVKLTQRHRQTVSRHFAIPLRRRRRGGWRRIHHHPHTGPLPWTRQLLACGHGHPVDR